MEIHKICVLDQTSETMENLANAYQTTYSICGFVTCALTVHLAKYGFNPAKINQINEHSLTPLIADAMESILSHRR